MAEQHVPDYQKTIRVRSGPEAVFDAITTASGLTAWWTEAAATGQDELTFFFDTPKSCVMRVETNRPTSVRWTVTECAFLPDWEGTHPTFQVSPVPGGTEIRFHHHGLTAELDCVDQCTRGWNHYLDSLREYVDSGHGMPRGSSADQARRLV